MSKVGIWRACTAVVRGRRGLRQGPQTLRYSSVVPLVSEKLAGSLTITDFLRKPGVMEVVVGAVAFLAYLSTLSFGFVYDDKPVIVDNIAIRSWHSLSYYLAPQLSAGAPPASGTFYRPVTLLWLRLNYAFFGLDPAGWHFAMDIPDPVQPGASVEGDGSGFSFSGVLFRGSLWPWSWSWAGPSPKCRRRCLVCIKRWAGFCALFCAPAAISGCPEIDPSWHCATPDAG